MKYVTRRSNEEHQVQINHERESLALKVRRRGETGMGMGMSQFRNETIELGQVVDQKARGAQLEDDA